MPNGVLELQHNWTDKDNPAVFSCGQSWIIDAARSFAVHEDDTVEQAYNTVNLAIEMEKRFANKKRSIGGEINAYWIDDKGGHEYHPNAPDKPKMAFLF